MAREKRQISRSIIKRLWRIKGSNSERSTASGICILNGNIEFERSICGNSIFQFHDSFAVRGCGIFFSILSSFSLFSRIPRAQSPAKVSDLPPGTVYLYCAFSIDRHPARAIKRPSRLARASACRIKARRDAWRLKQ